MTAADRPLIERIRHHLALEGVDAAAADAAAVAGAIQADPSAVREALTTLADESETPNSAGIEGREAGSSGPDPHPSDGESHPADGATDGLTAEAIREHYQRARPVYEALARAGNCPTSIVDDVHGWYMVRDETDPDVIADGFDRRRRQARADTDLDAVLGRVDRTLYALTSYKDPDAFWWEPYRWVPDTDPGSDSDGSTVYRDEKPMLGYGAIRGVAAWGDIDLENDVGAARKAGELDPETRATAEAGLAAYAEEFAALAGVDVDTIQMLDSVGGAYALTPPEATVPIAGAFRDDPEARERVMEAFIERSNEWLRGAEERVNERVEGVADVLDPDWCNNKNRKYKAPLSLHADVDAVVTPLDPAAPDYTLTHVSDVTDETIEDAVAWGEDLTAVEHTGAVETLVENLWPDYTAEHDGWKAALRAWVEDERAAEQAEQTHRERERERREARLGTLDGGAAGEITPVLQGVYDALDAVDTAEVVREHAADAWDTGRSTSDRIEFDPSWRESRSGTSCFVAPTANTFGDPGDGGGGYAVKAAALGAGIITDASEDLCGEEWRRAVEYLRSAGYDVPVWLPERGTPRKDGGTYEQMPFWAVKKAAVVLDVLPEDGFVERESDDGGTYEGFPGARTYNRALDAIEDAGLRHGRQRKGTVQGPTDAELGLDEAPEDETERRQQGYMRALRNAE